MSTPLVSVIVPAHDRPHLLERALAGIRRQRYRDFEVLVVDDGSTTDLNAIVEPFPGESIRLIRHDTRRGASAARNNGVRAARGSYVIFLDSDDEWLPDLLAALVDRIDDHGKEPAEIAYCARWFVMDDAVGRWRLHRVVPREGRLGGAMLDCRWSCCPTSFFLVRRDLLSDSWFDEDLPACQDTDLVLRLAAAGHFGSVDRALGIYHFHDEERISTDLQSQVVGRTAFLTKLNEEAARIQPGSPLPALCRLFDRRRRAACALEALDGRRYLQMSRELVALLGWSRVSIRESTRIVLTLLAGPGVLSRVLRLWRRWTWQPGPPADPSARDDAPEEARSRLAVEGD